MKRLLFLALLAAASAPSLASDVGVSIRIGEPGFYGRIDIGGYPQPQVIYRQPRVMYRAALERPPIYMHVPPGHAKNWRKHCRAYNACNERVYFVRNEWYDREYVPHYQQRRQQRGDDRHGAYPRDHRGGSDDRHDRNRDDDRRGRKD